MVRVPSLSVGLFITNNELTIGENLNIVILYRLLDDLFKLESIDWEERILIDGLVTVPKTTNAPAEPRSGPDASTIVGMYYDVGYNHLNVTLIEDANSLDFGLNTDADIINDELIQNILDMQKAPSRIAPTHIAALPGIYFQAILLSPFDGSIYNATAFGFHKQINGEILPVVDYSFSAVFVEEGVGMFDNFWAGEKGRRPVEENVAEMAEVWFKKL